MPSSQDALSGMKMPSDTQKRLEDALYADTTTVVVGAAMTMTVSSLCSLVSTDFTPLAVTCATPLLTAARVLIATGRHRELPQWRNFTYGFCVVSYSLAVAALTVWALFAVDSVFIVAIAVTLHMLNMMSVALRLFAMRRLVMINLFALAAPVTAAFCYNGGVYWGAAAVQVMVVVYAYLSAERLRAILKSEIFHRRSSETVAARFGLAIENMSHGMCMIDSDMRIAVANAQLSECLSLPAGRELRGVRFAAMVRLAKRRGALGDEDAARLEASLRAPGGEDDVTRIEAEGRDGRFRDLTLRRNTEGGWVLVAQDVTAQASAREALDRAARLDAMTGLPNRSTFEGHLAQALCDAQGQPVRTEVMFIDLDRFKQVNDTLGHKFGDRVLAEAANRLRQTVSGNALVARWGGDEFVVVRQTAEAEAAAPFAGRLIAELSRPIWIDGAEVTVGASAGASVCHDGRTNMDMLLQQADMALFVAKREARGTCKLFENAMNERARERRLLELDLHSALAARSFVLRYQPIVDLESGELVSFEALAQWRHPTRGVVPPMEFVPLLEEMNLMHGFGAWALQRACEDAAAWPLPVRVGVNVSVKQIDTLVDAVKRALASSGMAPERLELEITETAALEGGEEARRALEEVRALGCRVALDDFGTGYSSLSHLMSLPLDKVKIDKSFTQQLGRNRKADLLVAAIARLSSQLGMRVTFEGVETTEQLDRARAVGVAAEGQGWLFGRPAFAADLGPLFANEQAPRAVA